MAALKDSRCSYKLLSHIKVFYLSPFQLYKITVQRGGNHVYSIYKYPSNVGKSSETIRKILEPLLTVLCM